MKYKVFLSYSWKDMPMAMRLYKDLISSQVSVWRDQSDGEPTADFREEFLSRIDECEYFLMLDSKNYRNKSNWCCTEIERCLDNQKRNHGKPQIIVCLLDRDGDWRKQYKDDAHKYVFEKVNMFKYQNLFFDEYDNDLNYYQTLSFICSVFGLQFKQWNELPAVQDLKDELIDVTKKGCPLKDKDFEMLVNEYKTIEYLSCNNRKTAKEHFVLWNEDFKECGVHIFFPQWTYCVWLGQNQHHGQYDEECRIQFLKLSEQYPEDPRTWRGLGAISARLGYDADALSFYQRANSLINMEKNRRHKEICELEILYNVGVSYLNLYQYEKALSIFRDVIIMMKEKGQNNTSLIIYTHYCLVKLNRPLSERMTLLEEYIKDYPNEPELLNQLGVYYARNGENEKALSIFERSYLRQNSIQTYFHILCRLVAMGKALDMLEIGHVLDRDEVSMDDLYWKGAIYYHVMHNKDKAREIFNRCDNGLYQWYE